MRFIDELRHGGSINELLASNEFKYALENNPKLYSLLKKSYIKKQDSKSNSSVKETVKWLIESSGSNISEQSNSASVTYFSIVIELLIKPVWALDVFKNAAMKALKNFYETINRALRFRPSSTPCGSPHSVYARATVALAIPRCTRAKRGKLWPGGSH